MKKHDIKTVQLETLSKFRYAEKLIKENPTIEKKYLCQRAGISIAYFYKLRRTLRAQLMAGNSICDAIE